MFELIVWLVLILFFGGFILIAFLIVKAISSSAASGSASNINPKALKTERVALKEKINERVPKLDKWDSLTAEDISCAVKYTYKKGMRFIVNGTAYSTTKKPIIKYGRIEKGLNLAGHFYAASSDFTVYCIQNSNTYSYWYNNEYVGRIVPTGKIFNAQKEEIGMAKHPVKASISVGIVKWRFGERSFPFTLHGNHVADIKVAPDHSSTFDSDKIFSLIFNENGTGGSLISLHKTPTEEEELWLKLLAVTEAVYHSFIMP